MNNPLVTTHTTISFWDGVQKTQQTARHAAEHALSDDCVFFTRVYIKRETHAISLSKPARVLIQNHGSVDIVIAPLQLTVPKEDFFYATLDKGSYELLLDTQDDHKFAVTTITE